MGPPGESISASPPSPTKHSTLHDYVFGSDPLRTAGCRGRGSTGGPARPAISVQVVVNGSPEEFIPGEPYTIARGTAQESSLGIEFSRTGYQVDAIYQGTEGNSADLSLVIMTSQRASSRLIKALLPAGVAITPG